MASAVSSLLRVQRLASRHVSVLAPIAAWSQQLATVNSPAVAGAVAARAMPLGTSFTPNWCAGSGQTRSFASKRKGEKGVVTKSTNKAGVVA